MMTERYTLAYEKGNWWAVKDGDITLWKEEVITTLNKQDQRITELKTKLNELAFEFLNHNMISMEKAVEISEMSYHDFLKYRAEHGNPMELQL